MSKLGTKLTPSNQATILPAPPDHIVSLVKDDQRGAIYTKLVLRITCNKLASFGELAVMVNYGNNVEPEMSQNLVTP